LLSSGELPYPRIRFLGKLQLLEHIVPAARVLIETGKQLDGFAHREFFRKPGFLQRDAKLLAQFPGLARPRTAENLDFTGRRRKQAFQDLDRRGLSCTIRPEQAKALPALDLQAESANGFDFAVVGLTQIATLDGKSHCVILAQQKGPTGCRRNNKTKA